MRIWFTCLACVGLAIRATRAYIRTNDVAAHCATVARRHRYSCAMTRSAQNCSLCKLIHLREALLALCVLLVIFLVRSHLEYVSAVWSPHLKKDKDTLEKIQKFACRMATRSWKNGYLHLLHLVDLPSLECRRLQARLCLPYKIIYKQCYFDEGIFTQNTSAAHHVRHNLVFNRPFARTSTYFYSSVLHSISFWNNLDSSFVCSSSVSAF